MECLDSLALANIYRLTTDLATQRRCLLVSKYLCELGTPIFRHNLRQLLILPVESVVSQLVREEDKVGLHYLHRMRRLPSNHALIEAIQQTKPSLVDYLLRTGPTNYDQALHRTLQLADSDPKKSIRESVVSYFQLWLNIQWALQYETVYSRGHLDPISNTQL